MIQLEASSADELWRKAVDAWRSLGEQQPSRDEPTREIVHVGSTITDPRQRLVFSRPINPVIGLTEALWILGGRNDLDFLRFWNPRMANYSDDSTRLRGAYGHRLRHHFRGNDQLVQAMRALEDTPHTRQVVLQIWDCISDMPNPRPRSKDIPCNLLSHVMIRNGRIEWLQVMRSNDLVWGLPYNVIQFTTMQEVFAGWLGLEVGSYNHVSDSLHVYKKHWKEMDEVDISVRSRPRNERDLRLPFSEWQRVWQTLLNVTERLARSERPNEILGNVDAYTGPPAYGEWVATLGAEAMRRRGFASDAEALIERAGPFWGESWRIWARSRPEAA